MANFWKGVALSSWKPASRAHTSGIKEGPGAFLCARRSVLFSIVHLQKQMIFRRLMVDAAAGFKAHV